MKTLPESYLLFREEIKKAQLEKERLKQEYEEKLLEVNRELSRLKEQIQSQQDMMRTTLDYASNLEKRVCKYQDQIKHAQDLSKKSFF
jgi:peptidoglycan hydrolase CwlO-like protein